MIDPMPGTHHSPNAESSPVPAPPAFPTISIVIVNYRTPKLVVDCLRSLAGEVRGKPWRVVVVENGSGDDSAEVIGGAIQKAGWQGWAEQLVLPQNVGFAGGNNAALRGVLDSPHAPDYVLLLNPDTVVRPGAVGALADFLEQHPDVGIAGSRLEDPDGTPQRSAFRFPSVWSEWEGGVRLGIVSRLLHAKVVAPPVRDEPHPTDWLAGASMLVRKAVFDAIGLMDDAYFLYFEEVDFFLRARRAGWTAWYVPQSQVVHLVGQSSGVTDTKRPARRMPPYWFASRKRYFEKNHGRVYRRLADVAQAVGFALWRIRARIQRKPDRDPPRYLWDFLRHNFLPGSPSR